jgi:hypothetical protein
MVCRVSYVHHVTNTLQCYLASYSAETETDGFTARLEGPKLCFRACVAMEKRETERLLMLLPDRASLYGIRKLIAVLTRARH